MNKKEKLREVLKRVPLNDLKRELRRRELETLTDLQQRDFKATLSLIANQTRISTTDILGSTKYQDHVRARWRLYDSLHALGWTPTEIAAATSHDRSRIYHRLHIEGHQPHRLDQRENP